MTIKCTDGNITCNKNDLCKLSKTFDDYVGVRQYFEMNVNLVQTSCGFGVPFYEYRGERETLLKWANDRGRDGMEVYWKEKNQISLDGKQTNIVR